MISSILIFLAVLSVLVLVHELGHFFMARRAGILVEEFGFGLPPRIWGKKIGETLYSVNALPFGGFVKLHGESSEEAVTNPKRAFLGRSKKQRAGVIVAGVIMNFLLAIVAFGIVYTFSGIPKETENVKVVEVATGSPAQISGIVVGDIIKEVDGEKVTKNSTFIEKVDAKKGKRVGVTLLRGETEKKISVVPREDPPEGEGALGVVISNVEIYYPATWARPFVGIYYGFGEALFWGKTVTTGFIDIISGLFRGQGAGEISGPVGIFAITNEAAAVGILALINFVGILSVNLAILNIIPFPALDGGRLLFIGLEGVMGKKILPKVEATIHAVGMIILLLAIFAVTAKDIQRLVRAGSLSKFLDTVLK